MEPKGAKLLVYLPAVSIYVIILGLIKQYIYYSVFKVPIAYFINLSELGVVVSDHLLFFFPFFILVLVYLLSTASIDRETLSKSQTKAQEERSNKKLYYRVISLLGLNIIIIIFFTNTSKIWFQILIIDLCAFIFAIILVVIFWEVIVTKFRNLLIGGSAILFSLFFVVFMSAISAGNTSNGKYNGTVITTIDSTYISSDTIYFIGKTENYVFIYNEKQESTLIIPSSKIEKIHLRNRTE